MNEEPPNSHKFISLINDYYQNLLGYGLEQTSLQQILESQWNEFVIQKRLNPNSSGIYLPRNQTAIIRDGNLLSLFHEYFGHGLFCEQSLSGRKLVELEKRLLNEEKIEFSNKQFTLEDLNNFRRQNKVFNELDSFRKQNLTQYELFAVWTEYLLGEEFNFKDKFERKYNSLEKDEKEIIDSVINFSENYGKLATFYNFGLARRTTPERVKILLKDIYGEKLKNVKLAFLYGSKKPFSDIDVFIVSENLPETDCSWLDVRVEKGNDFEKMVKMFDVSITGLINSELIMGDKNYFEEKQIQLIEQPITQKSIRYNLEKSEEQKKFALNYPENSRKKIHGLNYSLTYLANALALNENKRIYSKKDLLFYSQSESIKMKGGYE